MPAAGRRTHRNGANCLTARVKTVAVGTKWAMIVHVIDETPPPKVRRFDDARIHNVMSGDDIGCKRCDDRFDTFPGLLGWRIVFVAPRNLEVVDPITSARADRSCGNQHVVTASLQ